MRDVKLDGDAIPTVQVNGEEVHILNGDGDGKELRLISNGAATSENRSSGFPTRSDTNRAVQPKKMARDLKFQI